MKTYDFNQERQNVRGILQECFLELAETNDRFVVVSPDISRSSMAKFIEKYPHRHMNVGIAEQNAMDFAAGLALEGRIPVVYGMATFISMRCCEQVRTNICYQRSNVKIIGYSSGITGNGGSTHCSLEDYGLMRMFPDIKVMLPGDPEQLRQMLKAAFDHPGPVYIRIAGSFPESRVYDEDYSFEMGKGIEVLPGSDATIMATGIMVAYAVDAARKLAAHGIQASVVDLHTIKPIDAELVVRKARETGLLVTVEDHNIVGGLGTAVAEVLADAGVGCKFRRLGVPDVFPGYGPFDDLAKYYGFDAEGIAKTVLEMR